MHKLFCKLRDLRSFLCSRRMGYLRRHLQPELFASGGVDNRKEVFDRFPPIGKDVMIDVFMSVLAADPADDLTRQAIADWLEEKGRSERANLIRTQLSLDPHPLALERRWWEVEGCRKLRRREASLLRHFGKQWIRDELPADFRDVTFRRGFADVLRLRPQHHETVNALAGSVPVFELRTSGMSRRTRLRAELLRSAYHLEIGASQLLEGSSNDMRSGCFQARSVSLAGFDPAALMTLADEARFPFLRRLRLLGFERPLESEQLSTLVRLVRRLTVLEIDCRSLGSQSAALDLGGMEELRLRIGSWGDVLPLFDQLPRARVIALNTEDGFEQGHSVPTDVLRRILSLPALTHLTLTGSPVWEDDACLIRSGARYPYLLGLEFTPGNSVVSSRLITEVLTNLFKDEERELALRSLIIHGTAPMGCPENRRPLSNEAVECLRASRGLYRLRRLELGASAESIVSLADELPELVRLVANVKQEQRGELVRNLVSARSLPARLAELGFPNSSEFRRRIRRRYPETVLE